MNHGVVNFIIIYYIVVGFACRGFDSGCLVHLRSLDISLQAVAPEHRSRFGSGDRAAAAPKSSKIAVTQRAGFPASR